MSTDERARIRALASEGLSVRAIARELGLSKSAVHRVLMAPDPEDPPAYEDPVVDGDEDPWSDPDSDPDLFDTDEERWPVEPFTFCGAERQWFSRGKGNGGYWADMERWVDGEGHSIGSETESAAMALYRYRNHVAYELDDRERAEALEADWARQVAAYDARQRARRA